MTENEAKKIGSRQGLISVGIGLLVAQLIMTLFLWTNMIRYGILTIIRSPF
jgi:hypothetical protein